MINKEMIKKMIERRPVFNEVMWKRLNAPKKNIRAIIVDQVGMDYYTNRTGLIILKCIEKGMKVSEIFELFEKIVGNSNQEKINSLIEGASEFLQILSEKKIITFTNKNND